MAGNKHFRRVALGTLQPKVGPDFFKGFSRHRVLLCRDAKMNMRTFVKLGFAALTMGASLGGGFPVEADQLVWARARQLDVWRVRWLMPPGAYFHNDNQKPASIAVNKFGQGIGEQRQTISKLGKKNTH